MVAGGRDSRVFWRRRGLSWDMCDNEGCVEEV